MDSLYDVCVIFPRVWDNIGRIHNREISIHEYMMEDDDKISFPSIAAQKSSHWEILGLMLIFELALIVILGILYIVGSYF